MTWRFEFDAGIEKDFRQLDVAVQIRILRYLKTKVLVADDPRVFGKPLRGDMSGVWRYRVGDYRILCRIKDDLLTLNVVAVGHRREVYD